MATRITIYVAYQMTLFRIPPVFIAVVSIMASGISPVPAIAAECVVLLHGLLRTSNSMNKIEQALLDESYEVINVGYPSRTATIEELSELAVPAGIRHCRETSASPINFVTHSLGGILVRQHFASQQLPDLGRVVMLGPPNAGTEIAEGFLLRVPGYNQLNGPAGKQLGTSKESVPRKLGPVFFELGVIAGTRSTNPVLSAILPEEDDGKVTVKNTRIEGMCGFIVMPVTHSFMMRNADVINQVKIFLKQGKFEGETAEELPCLRSSVKNQVMID